MTLDSTTMDSESRPHPVANDVWESYISSIGGPLLGSLASSQLAPIIGWYAGAVPGTWIVHGDNHVYPTQLLLSGASIFAGGLLGVGLSTTLPRAAIVLIALAPGMGSTAGYHLAKARLEKKSRSANEEG